MPRDLAVVVAEEIEAGALLASVRQEPLVEDATLFDVYRGPPIPAGKKNLALAIRYRAADRTLTDAEADAAHAHRRAAARGTRRGAPGVGHTAYRLPLAALGFAIAAALSSWNPLSAPFGVVVGLAAAVLAMRAATERARRLVSFRCGRHRARRRDRERPRARQNGSDWVDAGPGYSIVSAPSGIEVEAQLDAAVEQTRAAREGDPRAPGPRARLSARRRPSKAPPSTASRRHRRLMAGASADRRAAGV